MPQSVAQRVRWEIRNARVREGFSEDCTHGRRVAPMAGFNPRRAERFVVALYNLSFRKERIVRSE